MSTTVWRSFSLFGLDRLSILQRVVIGMCVILLLLVGVSVSFWRTITDVYNNADYVNSSVAEASAIADFAAQAAETRAKVTQYALSENDSDLRAAQRSLSALEGEIRPISSAYAWAAASDGVVDNLRQLTVQYENTVTGTIEAVNERRKDAAELGESSTELNTTVAAILEAISHDLNNASVLDDAIRLMEAFHSSDESATRFLASRNPADSDIARTDMEAMGLALQALQARKVDNRRVQRFLNATSEPFGRYKRAVDGLIEATDRFAHVTTDRNSAAVALIEATDQVRLTATEGQLGTVGGMMLTVASARWLGNLASLGAIVAGLALAFVIGKGIARPVRQMTRAMRALAEGNVDVVIPYSEHRNEIGEMAKAVQVFKDNKIKADRLARENETEKGHKERRTRTIEELNRRFDLSATELTSTLAAAAAGLKRSAETMFSRTERAGEISGDVKVAAQQASANIEIVANAAEELTLSIDAIGQSAVNSSNLSTRTTEDAQSTNKAAQLAADAREIERVVSLIKQIAEQTNLLALNATIEAARAGQAGRGFAVVAGEVKALASQTGNATEIIENQVFKIQSVTANMVSAIKDIVTRIGEMSAITASVAAAVDQQRAAARTIAQNAHQALSTAIEAVHAIANVEDESAATKNEANEILVAASRLSRQSDDLRVEVDGFIAGIGLLKSRPPHDHVR